MILQNTVIQMTLIISQVRSLILHNLLRNDHNLHNLRNLHQIANEKYIIYIYIMGYSNGQVQSSSDSGKAQKGDPGLPGSSIVVGSSRLVCLIFYFALFSQLFLQHKIQHKIQHKNPTQNPTQKPKLNSIHK